MSDNEENKYAINAKGVSFRYQEGTLALNDVTFHARHGEFVALLASNGSGKTTLLKALAGLIKPQYGKILIDGDDINSMSSKELYSKTGIVIQNPDDQLFGATVREDVAFGPRNMDLSEDEVETRVKEALEGVGAGRLGKRAIQHLSFGEKKKVAVAGVLAMRPNILILDEPTAGLDPAGEASMMRLLSRLNRECRVTVILATHSVDMLPLFADRIFVLSEGRVLKSGPAADIFTDHEMIEQAKLRLPYISSLLHEMKRLDGVPINGLPLTIGEARKRMLELIPEDILIKQLDKKSHE
ncbi:MAG TPA: ATP-binding cassette domain-containing protein [Nitrospirae bacterium]|nr:ATP-binding cassette domain-containing protein [Nitrospirota bacterium]